MTEVGERYLIRTIGMVVWRSRGKDGDEKWLWCPEKEMLVLILIMVL